MRKAILLTLNFDEDQYDALQFEADRHEVESVDKWLEIVIERELAELMADYEPVLSKEELRVLKNQFGDEDWGDDLDDEIPF